MAKKEQHIEEFIELWINGWSFDKIAQHLDVSKPTLIKWNTDQEVKRVIDIGKLTRLECIIKKYDLHIEASLENIGIVLQKIRSELERRDFSEIPTDKLIMLMKSMEDQISEHNLQKEVILSPIWITEEKLEINLLY